MNNAAKIQTKEEKHSIPKHSVFLSNRFCELRKKSWLIDKYAYDEYERNIQISIDTMNEMKSVNIKQSAT